MVEANGSDCGNGNDESDLDDEGGEANEGDNNDDDYDADIQRHLSASHLSRVFLHPPPEEGPDIPPNTTGYFMESEIGDGQ